VGTTAAGEGPISAGMRAASDGVQWPLLGSGIGIMGSYPPFAGVGMAVLRSRDPVLSEKRKPIELGVADLWHVDTKAILEPLGYQVPMTPCGAGVAVGRRFPT
jgi:hypothetical protein